MSKPQNTMLFPTLIMALLALVLFMIAYYRGERQHISGLNTAWKMTIQVMPLLIFAFITAGLVQHLLPRDLLSNWVGTESGLKGIFIGSIAGGLTPGGPYVSMPIAATLLGSGASLSTMVAFMTGWSVWSVARLPLEAGIMGWRFTMIRLCCSIILPPLAGLSAAFISKIFRF